MKPRQYYNASTEGRPMVTYGYPLSLPDLDGIEFAIVRPPGKLGVIWRDSWQVIHVRSGLRVMLWYRSASTREAAKQSAMAELERVGKKRGWKAVVRDLKRAKTSSIVAALKADKK